MKTLLSAAEVRKRVLAIKRKLNNESTHALHVDEDTLHQDVLAAIAESRCEDAGACARAALATTKLNFDRWYS